MDCLNDIFPIILYVLGIILLVAVTILVIKLIKVLDKVERVIDDISYKSSKLNGIFNIIDGTTDTLSMLNDKIVTGVSEFISKLFRRKKKGEDFDE